MEEGVAAAVDRIDAAAQIVPVVDFVHRLVTDDLFQNVGWRRPVDPAQHEKSPVEPRRQQMHDVAVERRQILVALHQGEQVGAHRHQVAGAAGRAVEPAHQLLPPRLGSEMKIAGIGVVRLRAPALDRPRQPFAVGAEVACQRLEERQPAGGVEVVVTVEHVARHRGAGSFAAARQQRLAQFEQFGGVLAGDGRLAPPKQGAAALGNRREQVGKEGVGHAAGSIPMGFAESYTGFMGAADHNHAQGSYGKYVAASPIGIHSSLSRRIPSASCR